MFSSSEPFSIYFVYTPKGNYAVKGMHQQVQTYVEQHFPTALYRYTFWKNGRCRGSWVFRPRDIYIRPVVIRNHRRYQLMAYRGGESRIFCSFRRIPRYWLPLYDEVMAWQAAAK
jgi:hypothetical protein